MIRDAKLLALKTEERDHGPRNVSSLYRRDKKTRYF
jgi:hypothetical protein